MALENPTWGTQRIRGELLKLGIAVSACLIRRYRTKTSSRPPSQTWRTFLTNQAKRIWAADLLVVQTIGFRTLYVLFLVSHARRELILPERHRQSHRRLGLAAVDQCNCLGPKA